LGDLPTPFIMKQPGFVPAGTTFKINNDNTKKITTVNDCYGLEWNSKTGIVKGYNTSLDE
jgi:hypothetical protein